MISLHQLGDFYYKIILNVELHFSNQTGTLLNLPFCEGRQFTILRFFIARLERKDAALGLNQMMRHVSRAKKDMQRAKIKKWHFKSYRHYQIIKKH